MGHEQSPAWPFTLPLGQQINLQPGGLIYVSNRNSLAQALGGAAQGTDPLNPGSDLARAQAAFLAAQPLAAHYAALSSRTAYLAAQTLQPPRENTCIELGEIIAWRAWLLRKNGTLRSTYLATRWLPGETLEGAVKNYEGIHAFKRRRDAVDYGRFFNIGHYVVIGQVALWGEVVEHESGYRASHARVHSIDCVRPKFLDFPPWSWHWRKLALRQLRKRYGVGEAG